MKLTNLFKSRSSRSRAISPLPAVVQEDGGYWKRETCKDWIGMFRDILLSAGVIVSVVHVFFPTVKRNILKNYGSASYYFVGDFNYTRVRDGKIMGENENQLNREVGDFIIKPHFSHYRWRGGFLTNKKKKRVSTEMVKCGMRELNEVDCSLKDVKGDIVYVVVPVSLGRSGPTHYEKIDIVAKKGDCMYIRKIILKPDSTVRLKDKLQKTWVRNLWIKAVRVNC